MSEAWQQAQAYVADLRGQGHSDDQIAGLLRQAGWEEAHVQALLSPPAPPVQPPAPPAATPPPPTVQPSAAQPPPPPAAVAPPLPTHGYQAPPAAPSAGSSKTALIVVAVVLGVLLLIAVGVVVAGRAWLSSSRVQVGAVGSLPESRVQTTEPEQPTLPEAPTSPEEPGPGEESGGGIPNGAGTEAALDAARQTVGEGKWDCALYSRTEDWREVVVWCTPIDEEGATWVYEVGVQWSDDRGAYRPAYQVTLIDPGQTPSTVEVVPPWAGRPCLAGALIAAREGCDADWVAVVASRTRDWTRATVWIGPPASEYVAKVTVQWYADRKIYGVVNKQALAGDEEPPGQTQVVG